MTAEIDEEAFSKLRVMLNNRYFPINPVLIYLFIYFFFLFFCIFISVILKKISRIYRFKICLL